jgi:cell division septation protein DedD
MENRLKERLTGAAILVALIVLIVPEMFHGPHVGGSTVPAATTAAPAAAAAPVDAAAPAAAAKVAAPAAPAAPEGAEPPVRSYTIDLTNSTVHAAPADAGQPMPASPAGSAGPAARPASVPVPAAPAVESAPALAPVPAAVPAAKPARAPAPPHTAATALHKGAPAHAGAHAGETRVAPVAVAAGGWSVQLGVFASSANAQRLTRRAQAMGFATRVSRLEPRGLYRVWIAGLADRAAAEQMAHKLRAAGLPAAVMRPR